MKKLVVTLALLLPGTSALASYKCAVEDMFGTRKAFVTPVGKSQSVSLGMGRTAGIRFTQDAVVVWVKMGSAAHDHAGDTASAETRVGFPVKLVLANDSKLRLSCSAQ